MKKLFKTILTGVLFISLSIVSFANKGTLDEAQARSSILANAMKMKGLGYQMGADGSHGKIDCSHY